MAQKMIGILSTSGMPIPVEKNKPYISLKRLDNYTYKVTFDNIPEYKQNTNITAMGCTSFVRDGKLYRNLDWNYDNTADFKVICKDFEGTAFINGLEDGKLDDKLISQLPYNLVDGVNKDGIMVSSHVLFNDFELSAEGSIPLTKLPYVVLSSLHSMDDINDLDEYLSDLYINKKNEYLAQVFVTDGITSYVITPSINGYELVDISANPKLTNFKWVADNEVAREDLQKRPVGVERWNSLSDTIELKDLKYTNAYTYNSSWLSEFIGINDTTKDTSDEELRAIQELAREEYLDRTRNGATWHTVHSIVYTPQGMESFWVQENYDKDLVYATKEYVDEHNNMPEIPTSDGEYNLHLSIVNGIPTYSWVIE